MRISPETLRPWPWDLDFARVSKRTEGMKEIPAASKKVGVLDTRYPTVEVRPWPLTARRNRGQAMTSNHNFGAAAGEAA